jgi:hypothetical protein
MNLSFLYLIALSGLTFFYYFPQDGALDWNKSAIQDHKTNLSFLECSDSLPISHLGGDDVLHISLLNPMT